MLEQCDFMELTQVRAEGPKAPSPGRMRPNLRKLNY